MAAIDLKQLIGRLDDTCRRAFEAAAGMTLSRTHYNVEVEHVRTQTRSQAHWAEKAQVAHVGTNRADGVPTVNNGGNAVARGRAEGPVSRIQ